MLTGSIVNALAILTGSLIGLMFAQLAQHFAPSPSGRFSGLGLRLQTLVMQGLALCVLYIGFSGSLSGQNGLVIILSMVIGSVLGELLDLDQRMKTLGSWLERQITRLVPDGLGIHSFSDGFIAATLLYCVGAMAVVGALQDGLTANHTTLYAKALLDGISSIFFSASLGIGVAFSAVAVFLYQGLIALAASLLQPLLVESVIAEMTCVGSLLIIALGLNMLNLTKIKVMNMVPAIFIPILLCQWM